MPADGAAATTLRIETPQGPLIGLTTAGVHSFKGIPYAVPPVGVRRWRAAEPAPGWRSPRNAFTFGPYAVQPSEAEGGFFYRPQELHSEDCLYLNVWTPIDPATSDEKLPVMVWLHGGGFIVGSAAQYDGAALARKGVVVVTLNYRLGVFGYFAHPELVAEAWDDGVCANFGTTDQIEALRWVQRNIAAYGGDPSQVTIFGESAGALSASQLMASPLAEGLFHRAIGQSGAYFGTMRAIGRQAYGEPPAEEIGAEFGRRIGAPSLADLRALSADELLVGMGQEFALLNGGALLAVDGRVFVEEVHETFRAGRQRRIPVLVGFNADEGSGIADGGLIPVLTDPAAYEAEVRERFGQLADDFLKVYPAHRPLDSTFDAYRDDMFGWGMVEWADAMGQVGEDAYLYFFTHVSPGFDAPYPVARGPVTRPVGAVHGSEINYVFGELGDVISSRSGNVVGCTRYIDHRLADILSDYWVSFAKGSPPSSPGQPHWAPYRRDDRRFLELRFPPVAGREPVPGMWELFSRVYAARRASGVFCHFYNMGLLTPPIAPDDQPHPLQP